MTAGPPPPSRPEVAVCVRHPDRATGLACTRCGRPACVDCLRDAAVGAQCVDCVREAAAATGGRFRGARRGAPRGTARASRPLVVPVLVALNVLVFAITAVQARSILDNADSTLFDDWALVPAAVADGEWWRVVTAGFLHIGPLHIALNMYALWVLGRDLETVLGRGRFLALYTLSLLGGSAAVLLFSDPQTPVAGASGAIFGLMSGLLLVLLRLKQPVGQVIAVIALNLVLSRVVPNLSIAGHIGGLLTGAVVVAVMVYAPFSGGRFRAGRR